MKNWELGAGERRRFGSGALKPKPKTMKSLPGERLETKLMTVFVQCGSSRHPSTPDFWYLSPLSGCGTAL